MLPVLEMFRVKEMLQKNNDYLKWVSLFLISIGILFRFSNYMYNHSLWLDEAWVAKDVLIRTYREIFLNIITANDIPAIPPVGFLLIEKLSVSIFGNNGTRKQFEFTIRFRHHHVGNRKINTGVRFIYIPCGLSLCFARKQ